MSEAATNAVLHAYRVEAGRRERDVRVVLAKAGGALNIRVRDRGVGVPGRGMEVVLRFEL